MNCINCQAFCCVLFKEIGEIEEIEAKRISDYLKVSISTYFEKDEDGFFRIKKEPFGKCPFLDSDNNCKIYEIRPDTCKHGSCENDLLILSVKKAIERNDTKIKWSEGNNYFELLNILKP